MSGCFGQPGGRGGETETRGSMSAGGFMKDSAAVSSEAHHDCYRQRSAAARVSWEVVVGRARGVREVGAAGGTDVSQWGSMTARRELEMWNQLQEAQALRHVTLLTVPPRDGFLELRRPRRSPATSARATNPHQADRPPRRNLGSGQGQ